MYAKAAVTCTGLSFVDGPGWFRYASCHLIVSFSIGQKIPYDTCTCRISRRYKRPRTYYSLGRSPHSTRGVAATACVTVKIWNLFVIVGALTLLTKAATYRPQLEVGQVLVCLQECMLGFNQILFNKKVRT